MTKQDMIKNYRQALKNGAFVSTDSITMLSVIKQESFEKSATHFADKEHLINQLIKISIKLEATKFFFINLKFYNNGKIKKLPLLNTFIKDKEFKNVLTMFLGNDYTREDVIYLSNMVEQALLSAYCEII
jgi:hypothetical protein